MLGVVTFGIVIFFVLRGTALSFVPPVDTDLASERPARRLIYKAAQIGRDECGELPTFFEHFDDVVLSKQNLEAI